MRQRCLRILPLLGCIVASSLSSENLSWFAIVRSDGLLIPFAQFDGSSWKTCWPEAGSETALELRTLSDIPSSWLGRLKSFPLRWKLSSIHLNVSPLRPLRPIKAISYSQSIWGVTTDYSPVVKIESEWPYPKAGLAFSGTIEVPLPMSVDPDGEGAKPLTAFIRETFLIQEERLVRKNPAEAEYGEVTGENIPIDLELRIKNPVAIHALTKVGECSYYFECSRVYPSRGHPTWPYKLAMNGWIDGDRGHFHLIESNIADGRPTASAQAYKVLGQIVAGGHLYAIAVMEFYEWERFVILRVKKKSLEIVCSMEAGAS